MTAEPTIRPTPEDEGLRILVIWPPQILSYFNAGHHLLLYSVAAHLRSRPGVSQVDVVDGSVESLTWKEIGDRLHQKQYHVVAIANDLDGVDGLPRLIRYARETSPASRLVTFGRLSGLHPTLFTRFDLDGIVGAGDYEPAVAEFVTAVGAGVPPPVARPGLYLRVDGRWLAPSGPGAVLAPDQLVLPDVTEIPYDCYDWLYRDDRNKFCGIPGRRELVVPVARGCPVGCAFCEVPALFGAPDRRLPVPRTIDYIERSFAALPFEYVAFYAPTFTVNRRWVLDLCRELTARGARYPWKCATTVHHLDEDLVREMGASGCVRISVGVETLNTAGQQGLPRVKRKGTDRLEGLIGWCSAAGIELNCFVIVGLPGTSAADAEETVAYVRKLGARVRPTIYTANEEIADLPLEEVSLYNRQILHDGGTADEAERQRVYDIIFGAEHRVTRVSERIRERREPTGSRS